MNTKIKFSLLGLMLFLAHFAFAITVELTPSTFPCGKTTVSATTGCSFMGAMEVTVEGNPAGVTISNVSLITSGNFTFDITVEASAPAVGQLNFRILTSNDPTGCALPNAQDDVAVNFTCACNLVVTTTTTDESCFGCANGSATVIVDGGTDPITYTWSNGAFTNVVENLAPGDYSVVIEDANDCIATVIVTVFPYICVPFSIVASVTNAICYDDCNGSIQLQSLTNGSTSFSALWNEGQSTTFREDLCAATYQVTVTDTDQCTATASYNVSQPNDVIISIDSIRHFTSIDSGAVFFTISGIDPAYNPSCEGCVCIPGFGCICGVCGETGDFSFVSGLPAGDGNITITLENGCEIVSPTFTIDNLSSSKDYGATKLIIYPNPTSDILNISSEKGRLPKEMVLKNVFGTTIARYMDTNSIDVSTLPSGMYFITFNDENHMFTRSFMVQK